MKVLVQSILLIGAAASPAAHADDYGGRWDTTYGEVRIQERAGSFCGEYGDTGFLAGYTNGYFARGVFVHADQTTGALDDKRNNRGVFQWIQSSDGEFTGRWHWGVDVAMSSAQSWNGQQSSDTQPSGSRWRRNAGHCLGYISNLPDDTQTWIRAARDIPNPNASEPAREPVNTRRTIEPEPEPEPTPTPIPAHVDTSGLRNCAMGEADPDLLWCDVGQNGRHVLDLSLCQPGSVERVFHNNKGDELVCHAQGVSGSYVRSCDVMLVLANLDYFFEQEGPPAGSYKTHCEGPRLNTLGWGRPFRSLFSNGERHVMYFRNGGDRRYRNFYAPDACPSKRFWNENGYLRCADD